MAMAVSLAECRRLYENHFEQPLPYSMPFKEAAELVLAEVGEAEFLARLQHDRDTVCRRCFGVGYILGEKCRWCEASVSYPEQS
jgi:ribosomal protein L40E